MFIICSYYTIDTPYQAVVHEYLMSSLYKQNNIASDICGIRTLGSWSKNTSYKPTFIKQMLLKHTDKNIVFVDADAEILQYPELFDQIPEKHNIAVHLLDRDKWYNRDTGGDDELLSGTLFVRNNEVSMEIIERWIWLCEEPPIRWEQKVLQDVIKERNEQVFELPISYCYIKSLPNGAEPHVKCEQPVIVHNQVSRELRIQV